MPFQRSADLDLHPLQMYTHNENQDTAQQHSRQYVCLRVGCTAKPFGRSADLERHSRQIHAREEARDGFFCDYSRCPRYDAAFSRKDHFRDHFRDYHKEDIPQRGKQNSSKSYHIRNEWWRCSKCLKRVSIADHGFECPACRFSCEPDRRKARTTSSKKE